MYQVFALSAVSSETGSTAKRRLSLPIERLLPPSFDLGATTSFDSGPDRPVIDSTSCLRSVREKKIVKDYQPEELNWASEAMLAAQAEDAEIKDLCGWLQNSSQPPALGDVQPLSGTMKTYLQQWPVLRLREGLLRWRWESADGLQVVWQWIPPVKYRNALIQLTHDGMTGGHLGIARTQAQLQRRAYWINRKADVQREVRRCNPCAQYFRETPLRQAGLKPILVGEPWECVAIYITGKHSKSRN